MPLYRVKEDGQVLTKSALAKLRSNVSTPKTWDASTLEALGADVVVIQQEPDYDKATQKLVRSDEPVQVDGQWTYTWTAQAMSAEEITENDAVIASAVRFQRDELLAKTDWMALSDNTMSDAWATYRQALRDITAQDGFPHNVTFPTKPE
jgi:hypothetical protein